jgi:hypothetical protein
LLRGLVAPAQGNNLNEFDMKEIIEEEHIRNGELER